MRNFGINGDTRHLVIVKIDVPNKSVIEEHLESNIRGKLTSLEKLSECTDSSVIESLYRLNEVEKKEPLKSILGSIAIRDIV